MLPVVDETGDGKDNWREVVEWMGEEMCTNVILL